MKEELKRFVFDELVYCAEAEKFGDDDDLLEAGLDSMGIMRLVMFVEQRFGVTLPDTEIEPQNVRSLNALEGWIEKTRQG